VIRDIGEAVYLFPNAEICGDDFTWDGVKEALIYLAENDGLKFHTYTKCWKMERINLKINMEKWNAVIAKWQRRECFGTEKYFQLNEQLVRLSVLANHAGLNVRGGLKVLDISCGAGVWGAVLQSCGHTVKLTDVRDYRSGFYVDAIDALGLPPAIEYTLPGFKPDRTFTPMPENIGVFDVITSIACAPMSDWNSREYQNFIDNCFEHLKPGGFILIAPNRTGGEIELALVLKPDEMRTVKGMTYWKITKKENQA
jgi:2-polyprenyl-3-methyl-5-hydroxy-6-metoxy-1,4-benzoquinol methylase